VGLRKFVEFRKPGHRSVFVHDLADDSGWIKTGDASDVNAGFGLTGTN
jgi:hypothetical protein